MTAIRSTPIRSAPIRSAMRRVWIPRVALAAAALALAGGVAAAQTSAPAPGAAPRTDLATKPGTLSDKLGATNGVIKPTGNVDPGMGKAAPSTGTTPVIRPGDVPPQTGKGGSP